MSAKIFQLIALVDLLTNEVQETMSMIYQNPALLTEEKLQQVLTIETKFEKVISF